MSKLKRWMGSALLVVVSVGPVFAGTKDAAEPKAPAAAAGAPAEPAATPNVNVRAGNANLTALLGVLVMKGVLAPTEANAIRDAAPEAQFKALVDALARKGVVSAADLPSTAPAGAKEGAAAPAPVGQGTPLPIKPLVETKGGGT